MFAASTVMIDVDGAEKPVACNLPPVVPVGVNQACNDPCNYPSDIVTCPNPVVVGMTLGDFLSGVALTLLDCLISYVASKLGGQLGEHMVKAVLSMAMRQNAKEMAEQIGEKAGDPALQSHPTTRRPIPQGPMPRATCVDSAPLAPGSAWPLRIQGNAESWSWAVPTVRTSFPWPAPCPRARSSAWMPRDAGSRPVRRSSGPSASGTSSFSTFDDGHGRRYLLRCPASERDGADAALARYLIPSRFPGGDQRARLLP
jgi:hypothetical protein